MPNLQKKISHGRPYWYIVEGRRVNGKPRPVVLAYLGSSERLIARLLGREATGVLRLKSFSHGAVAALWRIAEEIGLLAILKRHLPAQRRDGLTVAETLLLAAIQRAIHPGSKRSFAEWAQETTLPRLGHFIAQDLTSQHFWDQMAVVPEPALPAIEEEVVRKLVFELKVPLDTLLYDATNFFTYLNSGNGRSQLCQRGWNKQKRMDLRQFGLAVVVSREVFIPLFAAVYAGNISDPKSFATHWQTILARLTALGQKLEDVTIVMDKGNYSTAIQADLKVSRVHWVGSIANRYYPDLMAIPLREFRSIALTGGRLVAAYRCRRAILGQEMTVVMIMSENLRAAQQRGLDRALTQALSRLAELKLSLQKVRSRRNETSVTAAVKMILAREHLSEMVSVTIGRQANKVSLDYALAEGCYQHRRAEVLGRKVLITDREDWDEREVIEAYYGLGQIERVFRQLKNPYHFTVRPQYHWTDPHIRVHVFCCLLGFMLGGLLHRKVRQAGINVSMDKLMRRLGKVREVIVSEKQTGRGKPRLRRQLEEMPEDQRKLYETSIS
jgi:transposase